MVCECWAENPDNRPHFHELVATFSGSLEGIVRYLDFSLTGSPLHLKPVQLQLKITGQDHHDQLQTVIDQLQTVIDQLQTVIVSLDNVADCNAPVDDITNCNMQITGCNIHVPIDDVTGDVTDCSIPVDDVTNQYTKVVIPETNEQL